MCVCYKGSISKYKIKTKKTELQCFKLLMKNKSDNTYYAPHGQYLLGHQYQYEFDKEYTVELDCGDYGYCGTGNGFYSFSKLDETIINDYWEINSDDILKNFDWDGNYIPVVCEFKIPTDSEVYQFEETYFSNRIVMIKELYELSYEK